MLRIFLRKMTILRKILRIRLILRIRIFVNTGPELQLKNAVGLQNVSVNTTRSPNTIVFHLKSIF